MTVIGPEDSRENVDDEILKAGRHLLTLNEVLDLAKLNPADSSH